MSPKAVKHRAVKHRAVKHGEVKHTAEHDAAKHDAAEHDAVKHDAAEHDAVKHSIEEEAAMNQLIHQIGPNTRLAKLTMANWNAQKAAGLVKRSAPGDSGIVRIPLDKLDDSPFQLRHDMDGEQLAELVRSIRDRGLLNPILVRPAEKGWEIIAGHRRTGAYRRLQFAAKTDAEKEKYNAIPAFVRDSVTDDQVLLLGLAENMFRADISPLDSALGLVALQKLKPALSTVAKVAETTDLHPKKVQRLLELAASPEVVQKGVSDGIKVPADPDRKDGGDGDEDEEETRTLDLLTALQFNRLHQALSKKGGKTKDGKSTADAQTGAAIARALKENWGLRDVMLFVNRAISKATPPDNKRKGPGRPPIGFRKTPRELVIYYAQLEGLTDIQAQTLKKALQEIIEKLDQRPKRTALSRRKPVRKSA